jgi:hypothetical protein
MSATSRPILFPSFFYFNIKKVSGQMPSETIVTVLSFTLTIPR